MRKHSPIMQFDDDRTSDTLTKAIGTSLVRIDAECGHKNAESTAPICPGRRERESAG